MISRDKIFFDQQIDYCFIQFIQYITLKRRKSWTLKIFLECSLCFDQSHARPCNRRKRMGFLVTERIWFSICFKRPRLTCNLHLNLQEFFKIVISFYLRTTCTTRTRNVWVLLSCIVATAAVCRNRRQLFFNSWCAVAKFENFQNLQRYTGLAGKQ